MKLYKIMQKKVMAKIVTKLRNSLDMNRVIP